MCDELPSALFAAAPAARYCASRALLRQPRRALLRFGEHFGHELSRRLRAQQLLLRQFGRTRRCPRFLLALRLQLEQMKSVLLRAHVCIGSSETRCWVRCGRHLLRDLQSLRALLDGLNLREARVIHGKTTGLLKLPCDTSARE